MKLFEGLLVEHEGTTYDAKVVTATTARLYVDDHGLMPSISTECVDLPGLMFGHDAEWLGPWLIRFLDTLGLSDWGQVSGTTFVVLFDRGVARGVAGLKTQKIFVWDDLFQDEQLCKKLSA